MKKIINVQQLISEKLAETDVLTEKQKARKTRLTNEVVYLRKVVLHLETGPTKEFIENEVNRLENRLRKIEEHYISPSGRLSTKQLSEYRKGFEKQWGIDKIKTQLKTLNFILN